ncbi:MAG: hypothetical protein DRI36_00515, partial [Caldiserica bacterium]
YYIKGIKKRWKEIRIPLRDFRGIKNFKRITELVFVLEGSILGDDEGEFFIDDIKFTSKNEFYLKMKRRMEEERKRYIEELKRISELPDDEFLELISRKCFDYFLNESSPLTGFVKDRSTLYSPSSIAATGFGLAALCIGAERGWIDRKKAERTVLKTVKNIYEKAEGFKGFYYHFINMHTGKREGFSELSSVDTALLLAGCILAREYFGNREIKKYVDKIYKRINWRWMQDKETGFLYMGWSPEKGFSDFPLWSEMAEEMLMYIMALGSPRYSIEKDVWINLERPVRGYKDFHYIYCRSESLFTYLYSHAYIDFRSIRDDFANYWENSRRAIAYNIEFAENNKKKFKTYREGFWGISASDGPDGYRNYGATPFTHDGTIAPYAICGSVPFFPEKAIETMRKLLKSYGENVWGKYGFVSAFNLDRNWFSLRWIGIDVGISLLMIENYRSGFVWKYFMKNPWIKRGLKRAGFRKIKKGEEKFLNFSLLKSYVKREKTFKVKEFGIKNRPVYFINLKKEGKLEFGKRKDDSDFDSQFTFYWDKEYLYFIVKSTDNVIITKDNFKELYKMDCVEIYLSPDPDNFIWGSKRFYQIVIAPSKKDNKVPMWVYFQDIYPEDIEVNVFLKKNYYELRGKIPWKFLNFTPEVGKRIGASIAVRDVDGVGDKGSKYNWCFYDTGGGNIKIGNLILR